MQLLQMEFCGVTEMLSELAKLFAGLIVITAMLPETGHDPASKIFIVQDKERMICKSQSYFVYIFWG